MIRDYVINISKKEKFILITYKRYLCIVKLKRHLTSEYIVSAECICVTITKSFKNIYFTFHQQKVKNNIFMKQTKAENQNEVHLFRCWHFRF